VVTTGQPVTVLDDGGGPEACLGGVMTSLPPQCGGTPLVGWDWADHEGEHETQAGVRWGGLLLTGPYDGTLQAALDERYGEGVVRLTSALLPVG
jgi:hypothetical protein